MAAARKISRKSAAEPRKRDAVATRAAILASARRAFARGGYDGAGLREIAAGAGVTAMLVNRYFGSKEKLFAEVAANVAATPVVMAKDNLSAADRAKRMTTALVDITRGGETPLDGFLIMLRSASSKEAAKIGRKQITQGQLKTLAGVMAGPHAEQRAAILLSLVAGFQAMRQIVGLSALTDADPKVLQGILEGLFRELMG